jgi:hypothetical protein
MGKKKNTFKSDSSLGLFSGSGKPTHHKKNSSPGDKAGRKPGSDGSKRHHPKENRVIQYTDQYPHANIGWLFTVDY